MYEYVLVIVIYRAVKELKMVKNKENQKHCCIDIRRPYILIANFFNNF